MFTEPKSAQAAVIPDWYAQHYGLTTVEIADDVTEIGMGAYANNNLKYVKIPASVERIQDWAFEHNKLVFIVVEGMNTTFESNAFRNNSDLKLVAGLPGSTAQTFASNRGLQFLPMTSYRAEGGFHFILDAAGKAGIFYFEGSKKSI